MLSLAFKGLDETQTVLCLGAHSDDIEIGCGGALQRIAREYPGVRVIWAVFAGDEARVHESYAGARMLLGEDGKLAVRHFNFRESYFPSQFALIKDVFESLKQSVLPGIVFSHRLEDRHQDHRVLAELTWNTFRSSIILEYEIPKYEGDLGQPNLFVPLSDSDLSHKVATLMKCYPSQKTRSWFTPETFTSLARLRGVECASPSGYAEAFHAKKLMV